MKKICLWECESCGATRACDPLAHDDWGDTDTVIGPDCPECDIPMDFVEEVEATV